MAQVSPTSRVFTYSTGLPAQSWRAGISRPGGTTEPGASWAYFSTTAPSMITDLSPITASYPMWQEWRVHPPPMVTLGSIMTSDESPLGSEPEVKITVPSPMEEYLRMVTLLMSPLMTTLPPIETSVSTWTSPMRVALGAIQVGLLMVGFNW